MYIYAMMLTQPLTLRHRSEGNDEAAVTVYINFSVVVAFVEKQVAQGWLRGHFLGLL